MLIVNLASILIGLVLWFIPEAVFRTRQGFSGQPSSQDVLRGRRKQAVAGFYIALGIVGIVAQLHENVVGIVGGAFLFVAIIMVERVAIPTPKRAPGPHYQRTMKALDQTSNQIYTFLSQPENAAIKTRVMADITNRGVGEILIKEMGLQTAYGITFFESMQEAVGRIKRDEQNRPAPARPTGPKPTFDVVLVAPGEKTLQLITSIKHLTKLGLKDAQDLIDNAPSTILRGETQDQAELVRDVLEDLGATVELVAAEAKDQA